MTNANSLTNAIILYLNLNGFETWRTNTVGIYDKSKGVYRKNPKTKKGVPDVIGWRRKDAVFVGVEVKVGNDKLSNDQIKFKEDSERDGVLYFLAQNLDDFLKWLDTIK